GLLMMPFPFRPTLPPPPPTRPPNYRAEPRFDDARTPAEPDFEDEEDEEEDEESPRARKGVRVARPAARRPSGDYDLPSLSLLAAPKSSDRATLSSAVIEENANSLEDVLEDF